MKFIIEQSAYSGVLKIAGKVAHDMELVSGTLPEIRVVETIDHEEVRSSAARELTIIVATMEHSRWLDAQKNIPTDVLKGKRECYGWFFPDDGLRERLLVIVGSDKRGTIYGLFHLSEIFGVSPFVNWCHVMPVHRDEVRLSTDMACIAKEPSVEYRGFFINDEWPAFGTWSEYHFGGPNAKAYEPVFELLLRLKGNYLWPAMWSARFEDDGPGLLNAELADEYGVIMGMSHHEPCLRQGEEYKYLRGKDSIYGDAWNFRTNREGIIRFWEDGLKRSGKFENVITVGMRGEADTAIMGKGATLADNIELLRDVLRTQRKLIRENVNEDLSKVPRMIALYKEVEAFFYGDETTQGLIGSKELYDVILMLCDDNYGNLRTLPTEEMRKHPGGYGMYYHFDYHGWPTSYEWINSSYLPKIWEQMTQAYDFGVQKLWIVNVGDIATQEFPLSFFMDLAYDFERWGTTAPNTTDAYTRLWVKRQFGRLSEVQQAQIADILTDYTRMIHKCRPEALRPETYHAANFWPIVAFANVWKETGWNAIIYLAAITSIDPSLYEAAAIDGAGRWAKIKHVTLPGIKPTIIILLLMNVGNVLNAGFEVQYLLGNGLVQKVSQTIDIYVLKWGISQGDFAIGTAAGIFKSFVSIILIVIANQIAKRNGEEQLF